MSNVIKAFSVNYDLQGKKTIDTHLWKEPVKTVPIQFPFASNNNNTEEFVEGLKAVVVEKLPSNETDYKTSEDILEEARIKAQHIIEEAKEEAEFIKREAFETAKHKGYEEGLRQGNAEVLNHKAELEKKSLQLQEEYNELLQNVEPKFVDIMVSLIEKITGIIVVDKKDVIFHLVNQALLNSAKCKEYTVRVSKFDYEYLATKKNDLLDSLNREVTLSIVEDSDLQSNQCLIETETRIINCSLDVQLNNLITDLKLLSNI